MAETMTNTDRLCELREWLTSGQAERLRAGCVARAVAARDLGVAETTLYRWERGLRTPRGRLAVAYHRYLKRLASRSTA